MVGKGLAAILIMTEFSLLREAPALKPTKATAKPYTRHILGIDSGLQSHTKATPKPHQGHTKATPRPHQGHTKATPKPGCPSLFPFIREVGARPAFSQSSGISSKCQPEPPYSAAMMLLLLLLSCLGVQAASPARKAPVVLLEAEQFAKLGGGLVDQQVMDQMGSPYLLADRK